MNRAVNTILFFYKIIKKYYMFNIKCLRFTCIWLDMFIIYMYSRFNVNETHCLAHVKDRLYQMHNTLSPPPTVSR